MKKHASQAYAEIMPPIFSEEKKVRKAKRVTRAEAHQKFAAMHAAVGIEQHMEALRQ